MKIFPDSLVAMEKSMDMRLIQQRVTAANLANVDTPGYTSRVMDFQESMDNALRDRLEPEVIGKSSAPPVLDGNNVDLDAELSQLDRAKFMYNLTAQLTSMQFRQIGTIFDNEQ